MVSRTAGLSKNIRVLVQHEQLTKIVEALVNRKPIKKVKSGAIEKKV